MKDKPAQVDLPALRDLVAGDEYVHVNELERLGADPFEADWVDRGKEIPTPMACPYCNAPWTPEMLELVELSGYCETCADTERVIDVFCSACTRLVYRKEI